MSQHKDTQPAAGRDSAPSSDEALTVETDSAESAAGPHAGSHAQGPEHTVTEDQIKHMVDRFLGWKLPKDFAPDAGISYTRPNYAPSVDATPYGTNLLDAQQATAMVRHMIEGLPRRSADAAAQRPLGSAEAHDAGKRLNCPQCGALLWHYPDGRYTCSRCEHLADLINGLYAARRQLEDRDAEIDYYDARFNQGVQHVVYMLARLIGSDGWVAGDGSEDYDSDLEQTLLNILAANGIYNKDNGEFAIWRSAAGRDSAPSETSSLSSTVETDSAESAAGARGDAPYARKE